MLKRIVKMKFKKDSVTQFRELFESVKSDIVNSDGCIHLELLQDMYDDSTIFTLSLWTDEDKLNAYRSSSLFKKTWSITKTFFDDKPIAWSTHQISTSDQNETL